MPKNFEKHSERVPDRDGGVRLWALLHLQTHQNYTTCRTTIAGNDLKTRRTDFLQSRMQRKATLRRARGADMRWSQHWHPSAVAHKQEGHHTSRRDITTTEVHPEEQGIWAPCGLQILWIISFADNQILIDFQWRNY